MTLAERLRTVERIFLDTAPVIYYVEANPHYIERVQECFDCLDDGTLRAVVSPITLAECLVHPHANGQPDLAQAFLDLLTVGPGTELVTIDGETAEKAAEYRVKYNISLLDAFQLALAVACHCDAFLTNDLDLKRCTDIHIITIDELEHSA